MTELEKAQAEIIKLLEERSAIQESRIRFLEMSLSDAMETAGRVIHEMGRPTVMAGFGIRF